MLKTELAELIRNGENSGVEFKRDDVHPDDLAKEVVALLNFEGGHILLGVEDSGKVSGLTRDAKSAEEWAVNVCRNNIKPAVLPYWETLAWTRAKTVGIITIPSDSPDKPYKAKRGSAWITFSRAASTSRDASREEEMRLYQAAGLLRYDIKAISGTDLSSLDRRRLENYFRDVLKQSCPASDDDEGWTKLLLNVDFLIPDRGRAIGTVAGLLLFGSNPYRFLPQSGITATAYPGTDKDYATTDEEIIRGPLVSVLADKQIVDAGVIDRAVDFVARNMGSTAWLDGARRERRPALPQEAVREAVVNAVAHRDYTMTGTDVELSLYQDRLEVISPGRLPNTVTVEKMKQGYRAARNELLKDTLRDYGYVEARGMGVRNRIIQGMRDHNGTEPDLIEEESRFIVRLWKEPRPT